MFNYGCKFTIFCTLSGAARAILLGRVIFARVFFVHFNVENLLRYRCPCCGYRTLEAPGVMGLCPVCWWEDDGQEDADAAEARLTVNGDLSLSEARRHFLQCGASHPRFSPYVRRPEVYEQ